MEFIADILHSASDAQKKYVELLRRNLSEITSPFMNRLSAKYQSLTPTEITICNMIRRGLRSKKIAEMRGISTAIVSRHRERIRRKLVIANKDTNLATCLQTLS